MGERRAIESRKLSDSDLLRNSLGSRLGPTSERVFDETVRTFSTSYRSYRIASNYSLGAVSLALPCDLDKP